MESRAVSRYLRIAPRKLRLVVDLVRGRKVEEALAFLPFVQKKGAEFVSKTLNSAVANATVLAAGKKVHPEDFFVKRAFVDEGITMKRFRPASQGRGVRIRKRLSTLSIIVSDELPTKLIARGKAKAAKAQAKPVRAKKAKAAPAETGTPTPEAAE